MTLQDCYKQTLLKLYSIYNASEAAIVCNDLLQHVTGKTKLERLANPTILLTRNEQDIITQHIQELLQHKPIQYITGKTYLAGYEFIVSPDVLIPRPETDELIAWIQEQHQQHLSTLLDVGCGSGVIGISLAKKLPNTQVTCTDISEAALTIAKLNAVKLHTQNIQFLEADFLQWPNTELASKTWHVMVSNPPYIGKKESADMQPNVLNYEPALALFVPDDDVLIFYKTLAAYAQNHLLPGGYLYVEINEQYAQQTAETFAQYGLQEIIIRNDLQGKPRMIRAVKP
ncbi:MAG: peptide chain release factor N(5)-glutamine methyltransferase [Bacteroidetes bacterium]|nr:MAG: peptide chain release factor N(5)-glutamine methyltransferase [Bacteroidota bacterium]TAE72587.1 MAG: peptide chain release factor N(5)-glutamine methyltransferase [Bacteroidota bacterium]TAF94232.1 MAG: peptide chain release factor N(5)-glutamine methyltransferase [Bacteroidota bacterium]